MSTRARLQNANDSKSLWNYTLSPGWSEFDAHILRLAVMRYGCGAWRDINRHFPLKTCGQLNLQTQRLFGQQALAEFNKVHIDPTRIKKINDKIEGFRKNTCLINTGNNVTAEERERRRQAHIKKYGIPQKLYQKIEVPMVLDPPTKCKTVIDKIEKLREMYRAFYDIQLRIKHLRANNGNNAANIALKAKQKQQKNKTEKKSKAKNKKKVEETKQDQADIEMTDNSDNKNDTNIDSDIEITKVVENGNNKMDDSDVEITKVVEVESKPNGGSSSGFDGMIIDNDMDEETAMALALSASMAQTNINTPAIEKKSKSKKKKKTASKKKSSGKKKRNTSSKKKKKGGRKRKNMESDGDEAYMPPGPARKRAKKNKK